jgi:hypothetical protein
MMYGMPGGILVVGTGTVKYFDPAVCSCFKDGSLMELTLYFVNMPCQSRLYLHWGRFGLEF